MQLEIRSNRDVWAGAMLIVTGATSVIIARDYAFGTSLRMGPGYFPRILGILLIVLGGALALRALKISGAPLPGWKWRPVIVVLVSVTIFGLIVTHVGLVLATLGLIVASSAASSEFRAKEALISGILLAGLVVGVFVIGLKIQLPIWPGSG